MAKKHASKKSKKRQTATNENKATLNFLKFPPEIRNNIYDYAFVKHTNIGARKKPSMGPKGGYHGKPRARTEEFFKDAASWRNLAFATACRQVYTESSYVFFAGNGFEFFYIRPMLEFFEGIGLRARMLLTKVRFYYGLLGMPFIALRYLKSCQSLRQLDIFLGGQYEPKSTCWWGFPLKEPISFFLGNLTTIDFGEGRRFKAGVDLAERRERLTTLADEGSLGLSLTESLKRIKDGNDGRYKGYVPTLVPAACADDYCSRELPNVFADDGRSLVYRRTLFHTKKKAPEGEVYPEGADEEEAKHSPLKSS